jgi:SAM-dependent methyltransferase
MCPICGGTGIVEHEILGQDLIKTWGLNPREVRLINRQQGECCLNCGSNLRSRTLAGALNECFQWHGTLVDLVKQTNKTKQRSRTLNQPRKRFFNRPATPIIDISGVRLLEINEAGSLTPYLCQFKQHELLCYPQIDMQKMNLNSEIYDLVIHSDTLEHIPNPVLALQECRRILRPTGRMLMTIPILPNRLTRRRDNMPKSFHGNPDENKDDFIVCTEYGADFYTDLISAGWRKISLYTLGTLDSIAVICIK